MVYSTEQKKIFKTVYASQKKPNGSYLTNSFKFEGFDMSVIRVIRLGVVCAGGRNTYRCCQKPEGFFSMRVGSLVFNQT